MGNHGLGGSDGRGADCCASNHHHCSHYRQTHQGQRFYRPKEAVTQPQQQSESETMKKRICPIEHSPLPNDRYLSAAAIQRLKEQTLDLPGNWDLLEACIAKQIRYGDKRARLSGDQPLPFNAELREFEDRTRRFLSECIAELLELKLTVSRMSPQLTWVGGVAATLYEAIPKMGTHPIGETMAPQILEVYSELGRRIDRPMQKHMHGVCPAISANGGLCNQPLYSNKTMGTVQCPACRSIWDIEQLRERTLELAKNTVMPASEAAVLASMLLEQKVKPDSIHRWQHRGQIFPVDSYGGRKRYRLGDIIALVTRRGKHRSS